MANAYKAVPGLGKYRAAGQALANLKYGIPQKTLSTQRNRERGAQRGAYKQIAGYYAGLSGNAKDLMNRTGQVGQQTDQQLRQIGADRNAQVQAATPKYDGPLGQIAQRMADTESQTALNRGAANDATARTLNANVTGSRKALLGNLGAAQQVAGQERLTTLRGQGQQAINLYNDKIAELERQKALGGVDSALQLRSSDQTYDLNKQRVDQTGKYNDGKLSLAERRLLNDQRKTDAYIYKLEHPTKKPPAKGTSPYGMSASQNRDFWKQVSKAVATASRAPGELRSRKGYSYLAGTYGEAVAAVARSLVLNNKTLSPYAVDQLHEAGAYVGGRHPLTPKARRPVS
ncbi:MAG: hypothetical protein EBS90_12150, partial [Betaproteobacteria bacterium]|nr:hypothetical protein [Betaproteobacteria bacterium]